MANTFQDIPQANDILSDSQGDILGNFNYLVNTLGTSNGKNGDHAISIGGADNVTFEGRHRQVCFNNRNGAAPTVAGIADGTTAMFYGDNGNVFFSTAGTAGAFQLTRYNTVTHFGGNNIYQAGGGAIAQARGGWTFLPGGLYMMYGSATNVVPGGTSRVDFAFAFPATTISVVVTPFTSTAIGGGNHDWAISAIALGNFTLKINGNYNATDTFFFYAIGN